MNGIFETHAHYDDEQFEGDRDDLIKTLPESGIERIINISSDLKSVEKSIELAKKYDYVYAAVGIHPNKAAELNEEKFIWLCEKAKEPKVAAVGEIGLDYYWDEPDRSIQKRWLERQIEMAREIEKKMVIHSRDAAKDTLDIMKALRTGEIGGVIHCFSYGVEMARAFMNMGFYLGIGGVVTFSNARVVKEVVEYAPLERLVLETDSPYLAPVPFRGKRNCSAYLPYVVKAISQIKGISEEEVITVTNQNACRLYQLEGEK